MKLLPLEGGGPSPCRPADLARTVHRLDPPEQPWFCISQPDAPAPKGGPGAFPHCWPRDRPWRAAVTIWRKVDPLRSVLTTIHVHSGPAYNSLWRAPPWALQH